VVSWIEMIAAGAPRPEQLHEGGSTPDRPRNRINSRTREWRRKSPAHVSSSSPTRRSRTGCHLDRRLHIGLDLGCAAPAYDLRTSRGGAAILSRTIVGVLAATERVFARAMLVRRSPGRSTVSCVLLRTGINLALLGCVGSLGCEPPCEQPAGLVSLGNSAAEIGSLDEQLSESASIYIDSSLSMQGYLPRPRANAATAGSHTGGLVSASLATQPYPLRTLLRSFPTLLERSEVVQPGGDVSFYGFAEGVHPLRHEDLPDVAHPDYYMCDIGPPHVNAKRGCDNDDSFIGSVLEDDEATLTDELRIVITDMFLSGLELGAKGTIVAPLERAFRSGKSVGVIGLESRFVGTVYDIPDPVGSIEVDAIRPLIILAIGRRKSIEGFVSALHEELYFTHDSPLGDPAGPYKFVLFPAAGNAEQRSARSAEFSVSRSLGARPWGGVIERGLLDQWSLSASPEIVIRMHLSAGNFPYVPFPKDFRGNYRLWSEQECVWTDETDHEIGDDLYRFRAAESGPEIVLFGDDAPRVSGRFNTGQRYCYRLAVRGGGAAQDSASVRWLYEWSFEEDDAAEAFPPGVQFIRVLNLESLADRLVYTLSKVVDPQPLGALSACFRVE